MPITEKGKLPYGVEKDGTWHTEVEMRLPTMADQEAAIEEAGEGACDARVQRHLWARIILRIGGIDGKDVTPEMLGGLANVEYGALNRLEQSLLGKLAAASAPFETTDS